jgi:hypothetical protein
MSEIATGSKEDKQVQVRKAGCGESRLSGLEQGKGASPTYCYKPESGIQYFTKNIHQQYFSGVVPHATAVVVGDLSQKQMVIPKKEDESPQRTDQAAHP